MCPHMLQAAYMLGSPIAKEYSDFMVYSGRQFTTRMVQTVFTHLRQQASGDSSEVSGPEGAFRGWGGSVWE